MRVFLERGCRTDRKKARLKHLLEKIPTGGISSRGGKESSAIQLRRAPFDPARMRWASQDAARIPTSATSPQKQRGLNYVGVGAACRPDHAQTNAATGRIWRTIMAAGEVRLTVWQNFIIPNVSEAFVPTLKSAVGKNGPQHPAIQYCQRVVACTGNRYCKFANLTPKATPSNSPSWLEKRVELDQPVNIHLTGCPNSCAQHYIGDIGCLGTKARGAGASADAYHVFVGGGFGKNQTLGRQIFTAVSAAELPRTLERILRAYLKNRQGRESFQQFSTRHEVGRLQEMFANEAMSTLPQAETLVDSSWRSSAR